MSYREEETLSAAGTQALRADDSILNERQFLDTFN